MRRSSGSLRSERANSPPWSKRIKTGRGLLPDSVLGQKHVENVDRLLLPSGQEALVVSAACIGDKVVHIVAVKRWNDAVLTFRMSICLGRTKIKVESRARAKVGSRPGGLIMYASIVAHLTHLTHVTGGRVA